jgi:hypothetical protein
MKRTTFFLALLALILLSVRLLAMSSPNYRLDWFTPMTTGGGEASASVHYAINLSVGQTAIGGSNSAGYGSSLGYWPGIMSSRAYLPIILK